jgi:hypothetical protein
MLEFWENNSSMAYERIFALAVAHHLNRSAIAFCLEPKQAYYPLLDIRHKKEGIF